MSTALQNCTVVSSSGLRNAKHMHTGNHWTKLDHVRQLGLFSPEKEALGAILPMCINTCVGLNFIKF